MISSRSTLSIRSISGERKFRCHMVGKTLCQRLAKILEFSLDRATVAGKIALIPLVPFTLRNCVKIS